MMDSVALYNNLLERAREFIPNVPYPLSEPLRGQCAILIAEESGREDDWVVARQLADELKIPYERAELLEDIAKITQTGEDRLAAIHAADLVEMNLDEDFSPESLSFRRTAMPWFPSNPISLEEIAEERDGDRAELLESLVAQLADQGQISAALAVTQSILADEAIDISEDESLRDRFWCRSMHAVAVGCAKTGDFSPANILVEQAKSVEHNYVTALVEIARLIRMAE